MKTLTNLAAVTALVIAAASPALAKSQKPVHHSNAMAQAQQDEADRAQAYVPPREPDNYTRCCTAADY